MPKKEAWVQPLVPNTRQGYLPYLLKHTVKAASALFVFGVGVYCTILANLGVAPWDAMLTGVSGTFGVSFGSSQILVSIVVIVVDLLLKAPIGVGTVLGAVVVGKTVDLMNWLAFFAPAETFAGGILWIVIAVILESFGMCWYMQQALSCGAMDTLLVALGQRLRRLPIGAVNALLMLVFLCVGWWLGGSIGVGTLIIVAAQSLCMQMVCRLLRFEPRDVVHDHFGLSLRRLKNNG